MVGIFPLFLVVALVASIPASSGYHFRFQSATESLLSTMGEGCAQSETRGVKGLDMKHCDSTIQVEDIPEYQYTIIRKGAAIPAVSNGIANGIATRSSTRGEYGWRESKGKIGAEWSEDEKAEDKRHKCGNLQASCKCGLKDNTPEEAAKKVLDDADIYKEKFDKLLVMLQERATALGDKLFEGRWTKPEVKPAPNKGLARMKEKIQQKYGCPKLKGARQLTDVVRGSLIFEDEQSICFFLSNVLKKPNGIICEGDSCGGTGLNKVSVRYSKNRFDRDAEGMRDYLVNLFMSTKDDPAGHVGELQIHHKNQVDTKHVWHCVYAYLRRINEARLLMKVPLADIFCKADKCKPYHIDTQHQKKNRMVSALELIKEKWKDKEQGLQLWITLIEPYLATGPELKIERPGEDGITDVGGMREFHIYDGLSNYMTQMYDMSTLKSDDALTKYEPPNMPKRAAPMYQGETIGFTEENGKRVITQTCPDTKTTAFDPDTKSEMQICKCSQNIELNYEIAETDIPCKKAK